MGIGKNSFLQNSKKRLEKILDNEGLLDDKLRKAFWNVPRERFFPENNVENAYLNNAFEIGFGQTISQPTMIFTMLKRLDLKKTDKVLEIGTGSGYLTALLCELCDFVYSVEIIPELAVKAKERLEGLGYKNFRVLISDGSKGLPEFSPYNKIIVSAAAPVVPEPLVNQLGSNGVMVIPVGGFEIQRLLVVKKYHAKVEYIDDVMCRFVPLVGEFGLKRKEGL